jgi:hypothetical protein
MFFTFLTEEEGQWIPNINTNTKRITSFGVYQCLCNKIWSSARSINNLRQGCKKCNVPNYPVFIWKNSNISYRKHKKHKNKDEDKPPPPPHQTLLCEYCRIFGEEECRNLTTSKLKGLVDF